MNNRYNLRLAVLSDLHYVHAAKHICPIPQRDAALALEFVRRVVNRLPRLGGVDAIAVLGDLVDNGAAAGARIDLADVKAELDSAKVPILIVPGNHDADPQEVFRIFRDRPGLHEIKGYRIMTFVDEYGPGDYCTRSQHDLDVLRGQSHTAKPLIVMQHNQVFPHIESEYPYNLTNADAVATVYQEAKVVLSISGHYHPGLPLVHHRNVAYLTCPALCESPFRFLIVNMHGNEVRVEDHSLRIQTGVRLFDVHAHTEYAYCSDGVEARTTIARSRMLGMAGVTLTEHAGQLYCSAEDFWSARFLNKPAHIRNQRRERRDRMPRFLHVMRFLRAESPEFVRLGIEVELDADGGITLLEEDRDHFDLIIGAVHWLPGNIGASEPRRVIRAFMEVTERLVASGIHVLAHPFRFFRRSDTITPEELFRPVAQLLAAHGVAAEVNYHTNEPEPAFFAMCLEEGVKLALGSDAHSPHEVGDFFPHLQLLHRVGAPQDLNTVLFHIPALKPE